jgi:hypothetical protein
MIKAVFLACFWLNALPPALFTRNVPLLSTNYLNMITFPLFLLDYHLRIVVESKLVFV